MIYDSQKERTIEVITNNFSWTASTTDIEIFERNSKIFLEFIEFNSFFKNEFVCENSINRMAG